MKIEYTIGILTSDEGTIAINNPRVNSIDELREQYNLLHQKYKNNKLILFQFVDGERHGDIPFSDLEKIAKFFVKE